MIHKIDLNIPSHYISADGKVKLELELVVHNPTSASAGFQNFDVTVFKSCVGDVTEGSSADHSSSDIGSQPITKDTIIDQKSEHNVASSEMNSEGPYCRARDFPCEGGDNMVYACHYSGRQGYQTFCIPESDSEILRFYTKDYCGPCVGGYGGINWSL